MGLIHSTYDTDAAFDPHGQKAAWERFANYVKSLNDRSDADTQYKVLYLARHGEGYHNTAQAYYGSECWNVSAAAATSHLATAAQPNLGITSVTGLNKKATAPYPG